MPPVRRATRKLRESLKGGLRRTHAEKKQKPVPLVESTNALSAEEFISAYISSSELSFQKPRKQKTQDRIIEGLQQAQTSDLELEQNKPRDELPYTQEPEIDPYELSIHTAATIPTAVLDLCFELIEETSSAAYKNSSMGWSASEKRKEMKLPDMKYMILWRRGEVDLDAYAYANTDAAGVLKNNTDGLGNELQRHRSHPTLIEEFAGFLEFMVTYEDGYEVLYCYEIHLTPEAQGQGLGEELITCFERIGQAIGLEKAMLTVFKANKRAIKFYERVGYEEDENSPRPRKLRNGTVKEADYLIMSKNLR
ncbi:acyl-CoA N-acyltransferase [Aspergillus oleicola]